TQRGDGGGVRGQTQARPQIDRMPRPDPQPRRRGIGARFRKCRPCHGRDDTGTTTRTAGTPARPTTRRHRRDQQRRAGGGMTTDRTQPATKPSAIALRDVTVDGARLHYAEAGTGDPLVLLHGWPEDHLAWEHQIAPLSRL